MIEINMQDMQKVFDHYETKAGLRITDSRICLECLEKGQEIKFLKDSLEALNNELLHRWNP